MSEIYSKGDKINETFRNGYTGNRTTYFKKNKRSDAEPMFRNWASDPLVTKFLTWNPYESAQQLKETFHQFLMDNSDKPDCYNWKIELKELGEPIGAIDVVQLREDIEEAVIGYCLGRNWWHRGIMTEAFKAVIQFLFEEVGVNRIAFYHDSRNPHSGDVMKKCGLQYEGTLKQADKNCQGICDKVHYAILKEDYFKDC